MEINLAVAIMDNDSGYQESNTDSSFEKPKSPCNNVYINEDALLEKPKVNRQDDSWRTDSFDSVISASDTSTRTNFSPTEDTDVSRVSIGIPYIEPIVVDLSKLERSRSPMKKCPKSVLVNVTNTCESRLPNLPKNALKDKENVCPKAVTPKKAYKNPICSDISPDIFQDEEPPVATPKIQLKHTPVCDKYVNKKDIKLLKNIQRSLSGVCPPPNLTIFQMSISEMLDKISSNSDLFWKAKSGASGSESKSLLISGVYNGQEWPEILGPRDFGLHFNRNKTSEEIEHLCNKYAERYVGAETQSTCTVFKLNPGSPCKRKAIKPKWATKSPGRRLSHLARRRITFSSSNLQASNNSSLVGSRARQILVDAKKMSLLSKKKSPRKSPRKTPSKSPFKLKTKTPSSSAKKKLAMRFRKMAGELESLAASTSSGLNNSSIRKPLFSPDKSSNSSVSSVERKSTKRELFPTASQDSHSLTYDFNSKKRKRLDFDDSSSSSSSSCFLNPMKMFKSASFDLSRMTQSSTSATAAASSSTSLLNRSLSESCQSAEEFKEKFKSKLRMAIYESLRSHNILPSQPQFKVLASVLARVIRRLLECPTVGGLRPEDRISRLARAHCLAVVKGKSVDEIVNEYKTKAKNPQKPQGYVSIEEYNKLNGNSGSSGKVLQARSGSSENYQKNSQAIAKSSSRLDRIKKVISFDGEN